jgi:GNAT superfamily N-acetyltransferase
MPGRPYARDFYKRWDDGACPVCNLTYVRELPEDRRIHRSFHRNVVEVFEPKPNALVARFYRKHGQFIPVREHTARPLRRRLANISRVFKREFGCDFTMYSEDGDPGHGFLIADSDGRALGGGMIRAREYSNAPSHWALFWIWVAPAFRRKGLLKATWEMAKASYNGIQPDPPFSREAAMFFRTRPDVSERISRYAESQLENDKF